VTEIAPPSNEPTNAQVTDLVRQAMHGVAASIGGPGGSSTISFVPGSDLLEQLPALGDAVLRAAGGEDPALLAPPVHARQLLDALRRSLVDVVRSTPEHQYVDVRTVVRILDGVERVQSAIDRDLAASFKERLAGPKGLDLLIEVAHDLRSPLTSILYLAETLRAGQGGPLEPIQERQLGLIYSAAFELSSIANDLTELARGGEDLLEPQPTPFSISSLLNSVRDIVHPIAEEKGLQVRIIRNARDQRIGQPSALGRVMLNLTTNALRCTSEGFVEVGAHDQSPTRTEFTVRDSGPGMPSEVVSQLFEPFYPGRRGREHGFSSSGLGLAICRRLVTAMGGQLRVKTAPERGSCFYFDVPLPDGGPEQMLESARPA
jgi:signal transduction histidine kinase